MGSRRLYRCRYVPAGKNTVPPPAATHVSIAVWMEEPIIRDAITLGAKSRIFHIEIDRGGHLSSYLAFQPVLSPFPDSLT